ncbi:MAG: hypothetical protein Q7S68_01785 [Deltaproteobacteria bacterium]|nr:hypothetical protein [Deltaproteobacteria bacterium]
MMRKILLTALLGVFAVGPALVYAAKTTYVYSDRRFYFVKREELKKKDLKTRGEAQHPHSFTGAQLKYMLDGVKISQEVSFNDDVESREVFTPSVLAAMIPHLVKAFATAEKNEEIVFSYITRWSKGIVQNNRLTIATAWVQDNTLHLKFKKLMAKINTTNYDKLGDVTKAMNEAESLRIRLESDENHQFGNSTDELLVSIPSPEEVQIATARPVETPSIKESAPLEGLSVLEVEEKMKKLEELREKDLITKKEYQKQRHELLKEL